MIDILKDNMFCTYVKKNHLNTKCTEVRSAEHIKLIYGCFSLGRDGKCKENFHKNLLQKGILGL